MAKLKTAYWRCNLYEGDIVLAWNGTLRQVGEWLENNAEGDKYPLPDVSGDTMGRTWTNHNGAVVYVSPEANIDTLHHECIHVATGIFRERGVNISTEDDEHLAYYSSFWFREFYKKMKRDIKG